MSRLKKSIAAFCDRHPFVYKCVLLAENAFKKPVLRCQSCGQCVLSYNGFTCCMRCPKQLRNGPCGGTRENGNCEVYPDRRCVWMVIYERSARLGRQKKLRKYHIPVDRRFENTSAWINAMAGRIEGMSWSKDIGEGEEKPADRPAAQPADKPARKSSDKPAKTEG